MTDRMKPYADSITYDGLGSVIAQQGNSGPRHYARCTHGRTWRYGSPHSSRWIHLYADARLLAERCASDQRWVSLAPKDLSLPSLTSGRNNRSARCAGSSPAAGPLPDTGARSAADSLSRHLARRSCCFPFPTVAILANNSLRSQTWDDRIGAPSCGGHASPRKTPHPNQVFYAATVQEEGASRCAARRLLPDNYPDLGFSLEVGISNDVPGLVPTPPGGSRGGQA